MYEVGHLYRTPRTPMVRDNLGPHDPNAILFGLSVHLHTPFYHHTTPAHGSL